MSLRVHFFNSDKPRERLLADAVLRGAEVHGCDVSSSRLGEVHAGEYDVACFVGVKSRELFYEHRRRGAHVLMLDKGYSRHRVVGSHSWEYWRCAIDAHQPTARMVGQASQGDRLAKVGWTFAPWRETGGHVLLAGSSGKYHEFYGLSDPTRFAKKIAWAVDRMGVRSLVYRPKPSWRNAVPIRKARYSRKSGASIKEDLQGAWALVTHGSNACFDAVCLGIPCIILGDAVAKNMSSTTLDEIESPRLASEAERHQWLSDLAYWQWTEAEHASGEAWDFLGKRLHG